MSTRLIIFIDELSLKKTLFFFKNQVHTQELQKNNPNKKTAIRIKNSRPLF